jgi:hypothetical protein
MLPTVGTPATSGRQQQQERQQQPRQEQREERQNVESTSIKRNVNSSRDVSNIWKTTTAGTPTPETSTAVRTSATAGSIEAQDKIRRRHQQQE